MSGKQGLQIVLRVLAAVPILTGGLNLLMGAASLRLLDATFSTITPLIDTEIRFFGAIWLMVGIILYWLIPNIEKHTVLFRLLLGGIFLGGIGRLLSAATVGIPPPLFIGLIALELVWMPLLFLWQSRIAVRV